MDGELMAKWCAYWRPLELGFTANGYANGLVLTQGVFWARCAGGHNLYRWTGERLPVKPGRIVGAAAGRARRVSNFAFVGHEASTVYWYFLRAVGCGGVEESTTHQIRRVEFDAAGRCVGSRPNPPVHVTVERAAGGRFCLRWAYDPVGQEAPPACFDVCNDALTPGRIRYETPVGSVAYEVGRPVHVWTSEPFAHGTGVRWAIRARSSQGVIEDNLISVSGETDTAGPPTHPDIEAVRTVDVP